MADEPNIRRVATGWPIFWLLMPVWLHGAGMTVSVVRSRGFPFGLLDLAVLLVVILYLSGVAAIALRPALAAKFALLVYAMLLPLVTVEVGARLLDRGSGMRLPWPPMRLVSTASDTMPGNEGEIIFTITPRGVRAPDIWPDSREDRILCIGGSSTECRYVTDQRSWPWQLGTRLSERMGREVLVANAGRSGHFTLHHLAQLRGYPYADQFGTVVVLSGINDAGTLLRGNYEARAATVEQDALTGDQPVPGAYYRKSYLLRTMKNLMGRWISSGDQIEQDPTGAWYAEQRAERARLLAEHPISKIPADLEVRLQRYRDNLKAIIEQCARRKQQLVLVTQPTLWRNNLPDKQASLLWEHTGTAAHTTDVLSRVIASYNDAMREVAQQYQVPCVDLEKRLNDDPAAFYDDCHFNQHGCDVVAEVLCDQLQPLLTQRGQGTAPLQPADSAAAAAASP